MRCPTCGHDRAQAGMLCSRCGSYIPKSAAARAAAYDPDSEYEDEELYEAPESPTRRLLRLALHPLDFHVLPEREELLPFVAMTMGLGVLLGVPGLALSLLLLAAEELAWSSARSAGSLYPSLMKLFSLPAMYGLMVAFSGLFRALLVGWPWLNSPSSWGAWFARLGIGVVLLSATGVLGIYLFVWCLTAAR